MGLPIVHVKGFRRELVPFRWPTQVLLCSFVFTESCRVTGGGWNDLCGTKFPELTVKFVWKYNPVSCLFHIAPAAALPEHGDTVSLVLASYSVGEGFQARIVRAKNGDCLFELLKFEEWRTERIVVSMPEGRGRRIPARLAKPAPHWVKIVVG